MDYGYDDSYDQYEDDYGYDDSYDMNEPW